MLKNLIKIYFAKGFVGPYYKGIAGKLRFIWESIIYRTEIIMVATPLSIKTPPNRADAKIEIRFIDEYKYVRFFKSLSEELSEI